MIFLVFRTKAPDEEVKMAEDKFAESLHLAQVGMHNLIDGSGVEHISQVRIFVAHTQLMQAYHLDIFPANKGSGFARKLSI